MKVAQFPYGITDWANLPESEYPGASGIAKIRARQLSEIQLRLITYSANYIADHWYDKGHIIFVTEGEIVMEHQNGDSCSIASGCSYHVPGKHGAPHRLLCSKGATVFVID